MLRANFHAQGAETPARSLLFPNDAEPDTTRRDADAAPPDATPGDADATPPDGDAATCLCTTTHGIGRHDHAALHDRRRRRRLTIPAEGDPAERGAKPGARGGDSDVTGRCVIPRGRST
jgi:hypothetical protein